MCQSNQELTHRQSINLGFEIGVYLALLIIKLGLTLRSVVRLIRSLNHKSKNLTVVSSTKSKKQSNGSGDTNQRRDSKAPKNIQPTWREIKTPPFPRSLSLLIYPLLSRDAPEFQSAL